MKFSDDGRFPNSALPVLIYRNAVAGQVNIAAFHTLFAKNGWPARWADSIFNYHHYHSTAHEALGVASGSARVMLGGPSGEIATLAAGDAVVIPAGVAHMLDSASDDFCVVGGYPAGQDWDLLRGEPGDRDKALDNIARVPMPGADPVTGLGGALIETWQ